MLWEYLYDMDALRSQVAVLTEELATVKTELINVKGAHATLHRQASDANAQHRAKIAQMEQQMADSSGGRSGK